MTDAFLALLSSNLELTYGTEPDGTLFNISVALLFASSLWLMVRNWSNIPVPTPISNVLVVCIISCSIATAYCFYIYKMEKNAAVDVKGLACDKTLTELDFDARKFDADFEKAIIWKCGVGSYKKFIIDARADYLKKGQRIAE